MDARVALEIVRDGLRRDVLDFHAILLKRFEVGLEGAQVAREDGLPALAEKAAHADEKLHVIALHIPCAPSHRLRVRERRRVDEHQVEQAAIAPCLDDPLHHVSALEAVGPPREAVVRHVAACPIKIRRRHVHRARRSRTARGGMHRRRARIREQVQEIPAGRHLADHVARFAMVEEDAGVHVPCEVDLEQRAILLDGRHERAIAGIAVLTSPAVTAARLGEHVLGRHAEHDRGNRQDIAHAMAGLQLVDRRGGCVFGHMNERFALILARTRVQIDRGRVAGQVSIVDAVATNPFAARPLAAPLVHLAQTGSELGRCLVVHVDDMLGPAEHVGNDDCHGSGGGRIEKADLDAHAPPSELLAKRRFDTEALCRALASYAGENGASGGVGGCAHKGCVPRRRDRIVVRRVDQHRGNELRRGSIEGAQRLLGALGTLIGFIEKRVPRLLVEAPPRGKTPSGTRRAGSFI